jgi:hypothetical protein
MAVSHIFTSPVVDMTGTVTVFNSLGVTATTEATALVRPSNWNSVHNQYMTIGGNTAGVSTLSGTNIVLEGGNNVTLSANGVSLVISGPNTAAQSVQTQNMVSINGSTGAIVFSNSNNVSFGVNASTITASATFAQTNQTLSLAATSNTAGNTSGMSVDARSLTLAGYGIASVGYSTSAGGSSIVISASQSVQTQASGNIARTGITTGATAGSLLAATHDTAGISLGVPAWITTQSGQAFSADASSTFQTLTFQNSNGVSFSNNAGALRVTHDLQYTSATSAITSNALNTSASRVINIVAATNNTGGGTASISGDVSFTNANGATFYTSAGGAVAMSYSVPTQSVQTQNLHNVTLSGNSTSAGAGYIQVSSGTLTLAGGNNITLSQNGNAITISGANVGGAQTGISGIGVSDTTYTSGTVIWSAQANVTLNSSVNGASQYVRISGVAAQSVVPGIQTIAFANTTFTTGAVSFSNANGISFGSSGAQVTASYTVPTQTNQTLSAAATGNTTGNTSGISVDARSLTLQGLGGASVGFSTSAGGSSIIVSAPAAQSNVAFSADASSTFQTLTFQNSNNVSFSNNAGAIRITHNLAGTSTGSAGANVGISMTHNSSGLNLSITTPAQSNQTGGIYFTAQTTGQSSSSTYDLRTLSIVGDGIVSAGWSNGTVRISATQSNQAFSADASSTFQTLTFQNSNGVSFSNNAGALRITHALAGTATAITGGASMTVNSGGISFNGTALAGTGTTFAGANISASITMNSAGLNLSASVAAPGAAAENNWVHLLGANTAGNTTASGSTVALSGINVTLSGTNGSVVVVSGNPKFSAGISNSGVLLGDTGVVADRLVFVPVGNLIGSQSVNGGSGTLTIFGIPPIVSTIGNTQGNTGLWFGNMVLSGGDNVTLSVSTGTEGNSNWTNTNQTIGFAAGIVVSNSEGSFTAKTINFSNANNVTFGTSAGGIVTASVAAPGGGVVQSGSQPYLGAVNVIGVPGQHSMAFAPIDAAAQFQFDRICIPVLFSNATNSSNSWSLSLSVGIFSRNVSSLSLITSTSTGASGTASGTAGNYSIWGGPKLLTIGLTSTLGGQPLWIGVWSKTSANAGGQTLNQYLASQNNSNFSGIVGVASSTHQQMALGLGHYSATFSSAMPNSFNLSQIQGTGSLQIRPAALYFASQTV